MSFVKVFCIGIMAKTLFAFRPEAVYIEFTEAPGGILIVTIAVKIKTNFIRFAHTF